LRGIRKARVAAWLLLGLACTLCSSTSPAQEESDDPVIQMVVELLGDADRDMRAVGLEQVREGVPGEAATKKFAGLLPGLALDGRASLLEALGDRGDAAARPAVLQMLDDKEEAVRAASLKALGALGGAADVPLLAEKAATGSKVERGAARLSLVRLRGEDVNQAIVAAVAKGEPGVRAELLGVLAARGARDTLPTVIAGAEDPDGSVRLAALGALRFLADESHVAALVKLLRAAGDDQQRRKTELALLAVCSRRGEACTDGIVAGLTDADVPARVALLHALARAGGAKALETIVAGVSDQDRAVRDEAVRMLSIWPDAGALEHLRVIALGSDDLRHQVLAIRGLVRLASPQGEKPADLKILAEAMSLAKRPQEKRLVLGVLGGVATAESLALVTPVVDQPDLADEAGLAAVMIAERIEEGDRNQIRAAMEKVIQGVQQQQTRQKARKVLDLL
jgi:HEAT repeat protein